MFKKLGLLLVIMLLFPLNSMAQNTEAPVKKIKEMLYPTVMVDLREGAGSGTIIFKKQKNIFLVISENTYHGKMRVFGH
jgi:hypothetical protein